MLEEGWYLMSPSQLEAELPFLDDPARVGPVSGAPRIDIESALAFKRAGNVPDDRGRSLRLVLRTTEPGSEAVARRRIEFEPDYHEAPAWRRPGSKPVNVIALHDRSRPAGEEPWWEEPAIAELEAEWREGGTIGGLFVPAAYRSFVHKTVVALRAAGKEITPDSVADSVARWVPEREAEEIRAVLRRANSGPRER